MNLTSKEIQELDPCDCDDYRGFTSWSWRGEPCSHAEYHERRAIMTKEYRDRGKGNSKFRYSAENPPPTYPSWIKRDTGPKRWESAYNREMTRLISELVTKREDARKAATWKAMESFKKAKITGGMCYCGEPCRHWPEREHVGGIIERDPDGTPTYDSEVFRREMELAREAKRIGKWEGHGKEFYKDYPYTAKERDRDIKAMVPDYAYPTPPGVYRDLSPSKGLKLCPARQHEWQVCMAMLEDTTMCTYCGGTLRG